MNGPSRAPRFNRGAWLLMGIGGDSDPFSHSSDRRLIGAFIVVLRERSGHGPPAWVPGLVWVLAKRQGWEAVLGGSAGRQGVMLVCTGQIVQARDNYILYNNHNN